MPEPTAVIYVSGAAILSSITFLLGILFANQFLWPVKIRNIIEAEKALWKKWHLTEISAIKMDMLINSANDKFKLKKINKENEINN